MKKVVWDKELVVGVLALVAIVVAVLVSVLGPKGGGEDTTPAGPDPCSERVLNAPYRSGAEYIDRDQRAERDAACLRARLGE